MAVKQKKIAEMSEAEKEQQREYWRESAKAAREKRQAAKLDEDQRIAKRRENQEKIWAKNRSTLSEEDKQELYGEMQDREDVICLMQNVMGFIDQFETPTVRPIPLNDIENKDQLCPYQVLLDVESYRCGLNGFHPHALRGSFIQLHDAFRDEDDKQHVDLAKFPQLARDFGADCQNSSDYVYGDFLLAICIWAARCMGTAEWSHIDWHHVSAILDDSPYYWVRMWRSRIRG